MDGELILVLILLGTGLVGGGLAWFMPASGKAALALAAVPPLGILLSMAFC